MSRKKRTKPVRATARQPTTTMRKLTTDTYSNVFARTGFGTPNLLETAEYPVTRMTQNYALLNSMYRNDWIATQIIDALPHDMVKNWYSITSQLQPDQLSRLSTVERQTHLKQRLLEGLKWGRLFGGAAGIIVIEGQEDMLSEPLDLQAIMPGQFKGLIVADRWNGIYPDSSIVQDLADPDFGLPEYYIFSMPGTELTCGIRVHHSRIIRFSGRELPYVERISESLWGMSELEHVYAELNKRNTASANIAQLIFQANIRTYKMADLGQTLMATDPQSQRDLYQTLSMQNFLMSNMGLNVMDKDDDFVTNQYTFSGLSDVYELFMMDVAGAAEIPVTRLFGRSPAGMNATGESDLRNYYDKVRQQQEAQLRPAIEKLLPILCMSTWGMIPDELTFDFNPVRDTSDEERSNLIQQAANAINSVFQSGIISQRTALMELRQSGATYGMWSNITDEDISKADDGTMPEQGEESLLDDMPDVGIGDGHSNAFSADELSLDSDAMDYEGQRREKNGQFGTGKKNGGASPAKSGKSRMPYSKFSSMVNKGEVNTRLIKKGGINKHDAKSLEYHAYAQKRAAQGKPKPSHFTVENPEELRSYILSDEGIKKSKFLLRYDGVIEQTIILDKPVGISYNKTNKPVTTNMLVVEYSAKNGMHYYPAHEGD